MSEFETVGLISAVGFLVLALSALMSRQVSFSLVVKSALGWILVGGVIALIVAYRGELIAMTGDVGERLGFAQQRVEGETVRIPMSSDGHFWADVEINDVKRPMLIDSGATTTALSVETAQAAGIVIDLDAMPQLISTANGIIEARRGTAERLRVGPLATDDLRVIVAPNFGDTDVLGMNFLSRLGSWRTEGRTLILEPSSTPSQTPSLNGE